MKRCKVEHLNFTR